MAILGSVFTCQNLGESVPSYVASKEYAYNYPEFYTETIFDKGETTKRFWHKGEDITDDAPKLREAILSIMHKHYD